MLEGLDAIAMGEDPEGNVCISTGGGNFVFTTEILTPGSAEAAQDSPQLYEPLPVLHAQYPRASFSSSAVTAQSVPEPRIVDLGPRLALRGSVDMATLGSAPYAFLAADRWEEKHSVRVRRAEDIMTRWSVSSLAPQAFVEISDRLWSGIREHFAPNFQVMREWPMALRQEQQTAKGWVDMLVRGPNGLLLVDHKSFPGTMDQAVQKAKAAYGQLQVYRNAVTIATGRVLKRCGCICRCWRRFLNGTNERSDNLRKTNTKKADIKGDRP